LTTDDNFKHIFGTGKHVFQTQKFDFLQNWIKVTNNCDVLAADVIKI